MKRLLIPGAVGAVALAVGIAIAIAATGGGNGGGNSMSSQSASGSTGGATVSTKQISGAGDVLVDSDGMALYANDQETSGMALCDGACLSFWTPLTISGGTPKGDSLSGKLGVVKRPDGDRQVTYKGKLLYTFYEDSPGQVGGDGFDDAFGGRTFTWHVVHVNGSTGSSGGGQTSDNGDKGFPGY
jgi:predicted lipoprotein with Yx(FWY)xxD motif